MKRLRWYDLIFINVFWLALNYRNTAIGTFIMPFLVEHYAPANWINTALSAMTNAGLVIAMVAQPIAGMFSDRSTSRFGRRRPFIAVGVILDLVFLIAIGLSWNYWSLLIAVLLIQISMNISHGPMQGIIPDLVPEAQRGQASSIKALFELGAIFLVGISVAKMLGAGQLWLAIITTAAVLILTTLVTLVTVREEPLKIRPTISFWPPILRVFLMLGAIFVGIFAGILGGGVIGGVAFLITGLVAGKTTATAVAVGLGAVVAMIIAIVAGVWAGSMTAIGKETRQHSSFVWWIVNRLFFLAAITSIQRFAIYFFMYAFKIDVNPATAMLGKLLIIVGIFTLAMALGAGWLAERISHKLLVGWSGIIAALGGILLLSTLWVPNQTLIYVAGTMLGIASGAFLTINWTMGTNLVPPEEAGRFLGISNLAGAGAGLIGGSFGGPVADYLNLQLPGLGYGVVFASYSVLFICSTISLRFIRGHKPTAPMSIRE